jgi:guanyl-specific ribonuclease Sa
MRRLLPVIGFIVALIVFRHYMRPEETPIPRPTVTADADPAASAVRSPARAESAAGVIQGPADSAVMREHAKTAVAHVRLTLTDDVTLASGRQVFLGPTLDRIAQGVGNEFPGDGIEFPNAPDRKSGQRLLPERPAGYYVEFVHPAPERPDNAGVMRIIVGRDGDVWFSPDSYRTATPLNKDRAQ